MSGDRYNTRMIKTYPTLYSRDSIGNIRIWWIEQSGNKYQMNSGIKDGQIVTSEYTTCEGKNLGKTNETSDIEQATAEILAKYKKQRDTGYFDEITDVDKETFFSPQLAHKWEDYKDDVDWTSGVYVSPKMDGMRTVITKNGAASRNGKEFKSFPHILRELKPVFDKFPLLRLDGEVYTNKLSNDFNKIISLAKKTKPTSQDLVESEKFLEYWVFDCPSFSGGFNERYTELVKFFDENFKDNKWIKLCKHSLIKNKSDIEFHLNDYINQGFEGLMVNTFNGKYLQKRSKELLKYKIFQTEEFEVINITEGIGNRSGCMGYATVKLNNGKTCDSSARGNFEQYKEILENKDKYIGTMATIRFQGYTPDGILRFPVIIEWNREDC